MTNPTVTQADRSAARAIQLLVSEQLKAFGLDVIDDGTESPELIQAFAAHRELGKSEGYAQAVDDVAALLPEILRDHCRFPSGQPRISLDLATSIIADAIAALKENRRG